MRRWMVGSCWVLSVLLAQAFDVETSSAALINGTIVHNKPVRFEATLIHQGLLPDPATLVLGGPDPDGFSGNWSVVITQDTSLLGGAADGDFLFEVFHNVAPHPELGERGLNLTDMFLFAVLPGNAATDVALGEFPLGPAAVKFPGPNSMPVLPARSVHGAAHFDIIDVSYQSIAFNTSMITVTAVHESVPGPSSFILFVAGLAALAAAAWKQHSAGSRTRSPLVRRRFRQRRET